VKKQLKQRSAIEPVIEHLKSSHRLSRSYLSGVFGENINVMLAAAGYNFKQLLRKLNYFLRDILYRVFVKNVGQTVLEMDFYGSTTYLIGSNSFLAPTAMNSAVKPKPYMSSQGYTLYPKRSSAPIECMTSGVSNVLFFPIAAATMLRKPLIWCSSTWEINVPAGIPPRS